ncbi:MAG: hypothetical protein HPY53_12890 [Brevinematales bacterium]|nr:hypothetical protein [Brevinematales bacterium]
MGDFKVEKVTDVPGYSAKLTKRKKFLARVALAILSSLVIGANLGCSPMGGIPIPVPPTPNVNIYIKLSTVDNAQDLYEPVGGVTNAIYAVGNFGGLKVNGVAIPVWDPSSAVAQLTRVSADMFKLELLNYLTNNASLSFRFVNGSPGFGGTWTNEEQEFTDDGSTFEGVSNRTLTIFPAYSYWNFTNIYMTNDVVSNIGGTAMGCITHWKGVTSTMP